MQFRISYKMPGGMRCARWVEAPDVNKAVDIVNVEDAPESIGRISVRCGAPTTQYAGGGFDTCRRLTTTGRCPAHRDLPVHNGTKHYLCDVCGDYCGK